MRKEWIAAPKRTSEILKHYQLQAKKSLGQNFLMDPQVLEDMVHVAEVDKQTDVIEIGPGIGALTEFLAERARRVVSFELDQRMLPVLEAELGHYENLTIVPQDILKVDLQQEVADYFPDSQRLVVVANLPYYITTPILFHLLEAQLPIEAYALMMQYEVAERLTASSGTKAYGAITVVMDYYGQAEIALKVPHTAFKPQPKVDSAVLYLKARKEPSVELVNPDFFFKWVQACFQQRRKTLWNNLKRFFSGRDQVEERLMRALERCTIDPKIRAEKLDLADFARLEKALNQEGLIPQVSNG